MMEKMETALVFLCRMWMALGIMLALFITLPFILLALVVVFVHRIIHSCFEEVLCLF